jgi:hypothetical protein
MILNHGNIKEGLMKTVPLHRKTGREGIFQSSYASRLEMIVLLHKLVSVTTDGTSAMTSENVRLNRL